MDWLFPPSTLASFCNEPSWLEEDSKCMQTQGYMTSPVTGPGLGGWTKEALFPRGVNLESLSPGARGAISCQAEDGWGVFVWEWSQCADGIRLEPRRKSSVSQWLLWSHFIMPRLELVLPVDFQLIRALIFLICLNQLRLVSKSLTQRVQVEPPLITKIKGLNFC